MRWFSPKFVKRVCVGVLSWYLIGLSNVPAEEEPSEIVLDIGSMIPRPLLGFGWSVSEIEKGRFYRWIDHLEADVTIELDRVGDSTLWVRAGAQYVPYTRQTVSVYFNGVYVGEWVCVGHPGFVTYQLTVPARVLKKGKNRMTLRMAYRKQVGPDRRELALCVDMIRLKVY